MRPNRKTATGARTKRVVRHKIQVLILGEGGTIQMGPKKMRGGQIRYAPPKSAAQFRANLMEALLPFRDIAEFTFRPVSTADSINKQPEDWINMIHRVNQAYLEGFDLVIITHGTDTLAFSALALCLGTQGLEPRQHYLPFPCVFTGSQNPVGVPGGDGIRNIQNAVRTGLEAYRCGVADVLVVFDAAVLPGHYTMKVSERRFTAFDCPGRPAVGWIDAKGPHLDTSRLRLRHDVVQHDMTAAAKFDTSGILDIVANPGFNPRLLRSVIRTPELRTLILTSHGEGNICHLGKRSLVPLIREARERGVLVLITSPYDAAEISGTTYQAAEIAREAGAIHSGRLNMVGTWTLPAWLQANFPKATAEQLAEKLVILAG